VVLGLVSPSVLRLELKAGPVHGFFEIRLALKVAVAYGTQSSLEGPVDT
jgi:hypothetical protein